MKITTFSQGIRYIEMELLDGDLHTEIRKHRLGHLPPEMSGKFLKHITSGLMHLHSRRLIHRDIKPGNIFVSGSIAKIGDFGLTVEMGPNVTVAGTPNYLPYDIWNSVVPMTIRADLWGLGCVLQLILKIIMKLFAGQFWKEFCCGRFFFCDMLRIPRYEMMCGELLYEDLPTEDVTIPRVNWPVFNGSLQTAFYQLMSTPSHVSALTVVGALSSFRFVLFCFCSVCVFLSSVFRFSLFCFALILFCLRVFVFVGFLRDSICSLMELSSHL